MSLDGRRVVLGVTGGIAAYKAIEVCRRLMDAGAHVSPVLTRAATRFVGEVTFSALASEPARVSLWEDDDPIPHTSLGQGADVVVVCPATARLIGAYAGGLSHDLLTATLLATRAPVVVCPAMHTEMWEHPAVRENLTTLRRRGVHVVEPESGRLAGGDVGAGRLADPAAVVAEISAVLEGGDPADRDLEGLTVLVTAGGTREPIDPVRCIANRSSGKQGHALAEDAAARGATVTLVTTADLPAPPGAEVIRVDTAAELATAVHRHAERSDVIVMAAAVADFRPRQTASAKIKKGDGVPTIELEATEDILAGLGASSRPDQVIVGFAAETDSLRDRARAKLEAKNIDLIVANDVAAPDAGFEHDTNEVLIMSRSGSVRDVALTDKRAVARAVLDEVVSHRSTR